MSHEKFGQTFLIHEILPINESVVSKEYLIFIMVPKWLF